MDVVARLGSLQFDPLEVPGARNHDLVLHARIGGYQRAWCEALLYGPDRRLIELYNKSLNILPIEELPHFAVAWERSAAWHNDGILTEQADVVTAVIERLGIEGPLTTAAFAADHGHTIEWSWAPTRASRAVMEALFVVGRIGVARRDGNRRYYDLIERIVPAELLARARVDGGRHDPPAPVALPRHRHDDLDRDPERGHVQRRLAAGARRPNGPSRGRGRAAPHRGRGPEAGPVHHRRRGSDPRRDRAARRARRPRRVVPRPARPPRLGPQDASHALELRLPVGGLRSRGEAQVGLLRPADAVGRPVRRPHRATLRPSRPNARA